jgi:hypothetical protein
MRKNNAEVSYGNARTNTSPVDIPKTTRTHTVDVMTSMPAGKCIPVAAIPLLQGDQLRSTTVAMKVRMDETADELLNGVTVKMSAYLVPNLAKARFDGSMDQLMRSYHGEAPYSGGSPIDYINVGDIGTPDEDNIHYYMGEHVIDSANANTDYVECYNIIWNHRAKNRSKNIILRDEFLTDVAPAFWHHRQFNNIVSEYDQELIIGAVDIDVVQSKLNLRGIGREGSTYPNTNVTVRETGGIETEYAATAVTNTQNIHVEEDPDNPGYPNLWAELTDGSLTMSLADVAAARRTEKFAKLRQKYTGLDEDWEIDRLMMGLEISDQMYKQPILLDTTMGALGTSTRYSTTAGSLDEKTSQGAGIFKLNLATPPVQCGGTIMILVEILPDQIFERQKNYWLEAGDVSDLPQALRDFLDVEPVEVVENSHIDVEHSAGTDTFGFMPKNDQWNVVATRIGGKYFRDNGSPTYDQDREKLWIVEPTDPTLTTEWYVATSMNQNPFIDSDQDPFDIQVKGMGKIRGLTQFGGQLVESDNEWADTRALMDNSRNEETSVND